MGKYMRKAKLTGDIAVMEVTQSSLGVRTRAKTLALQRLQELPEHPPQNPEFSYLQLRSRRLEKPPLQKPICCQKNSCSKNPCQKTNPRASHSGSVGSVSVSNFSNKEEGFLDGTLGVASKQGGAEGNCDFGSEASFGENNLAFEGRERSSRESTPCSLIRDSSTIGTPGSSTRPTNLCDSASGRISNPVLPNFPTAQEVEEFFVRAEQQQQRIFAEKYNFDVVNGLPLLGRYEWVKVKP